MVPKWGPGIGPSGVLQAVPGGWGLRKSQFDDIRVTTSVLKRAREKTYHVYTCFTFTIVTQRWPYRLFQSTGNIIL